MARFDDEDESETIACPHCRKQIHEESERCPYCEKYLSDEEMLPNRKPWWIVIGALACLYAVYRWIAG
jgi:ferredoxin-thioredoxin reductase catalytic subunit